MKTFHDFKETELSETERQDAIIEKINAKLGCIAIPDEEHTRELILLYMNEVLGMLSRYDGDGDMQYWFGNLGIFFSLADDVWTIKATRAISFKIYEDRAMEVAEKIVNAFKD